MVKPTFVVTLSADIYLTLRKIVYNRHHLHFLHSFADSDAKNFKYLFIIPTEYASYRRARAPRRAQFKYLFSLISPRPPRLIDGHELHFPSVECASSPIKSFVRESTNERDSAVDMCKPGSDLRNHRLITSRTTHLTENPSSFGLSSREGGLLFFHVISRATRERKRKNLELE